MTSSGQENSLPPAMGITGGLIRQINDKEKNTSLDTIKICQESNLFKKACLTAAQEDTVHVSLWLDTKDVTDLFERLETAKEERQKCEIRHKRGKAEDSHSPRLVLGADGVAYMIGEMEQESEDAYHLPGTVKFGGETFVMGARGFGGEDGKPFFEYVMQSQGITIALRNHEATESVCNGLVELGSLPLTRYGGLPKLWPVVVQLLAKETLKIMRHVVGRYDLCMDILNIPFIEFQKRYIKGKWISRARKWDENSDSSTSWGCGPNPQGFARGKALRLNCYDKMKELTDKNSTDKYNALIECKFEGNYPVDITRVEFQCRREALKAFLVEPGFRIDTVEDCLEHRASLWHYLTTKFIRMIQGKVDKKNRNHDRAKTWALWERIGKHGEVTLNGQVMPIQKKLRRSPTNPDALGKQAVGCIMKQAVYNGMKNGDMLAVAREFIKQVKKLDSAEISRKATEKAAAVRQENNGISAKDFRQLV